MAKELEPKESTLFQTKLGLLVARIDDICDDVHKKLLGQDKLRLNQIKEVHEDENYVVAEFYGGLNGANKWVGYLASIKHLIATIKEENNCWVIKLENDCLDDVYTLLVGIEL